MTKKQIDLGGSQGNVFYLLTTAKHFAKQLDLDEQKILTEMRSGTYQNAVNVFLNYFGEYVELVGEIY